jgi:hypothetical protein
MSYRSDPFRPSWRVRTPTGSELTIEFDRLRRLWRVSPGDYTRRRLSDALAQATNQPRDADWIAELERDTTTELERRADRSS